MREVFSVDRFKVIRGRLSWLWPGRLIYNKLLGWDHRRVLFCLWLGVSLCYNIPDFLIAPLLVSPTICRVVLTFRLEFLASLGQLFSSINNYFLDDSAFPWSTFSFRMKSWLFARSEFGRTMLGYVLSVAMRVLVHAVPEPTLSDWIIIFPRTARHFNYLNLFEVKN